MAILFLGSVKAILATFSVYNFRMRRASGLFLAGALFALTGALSNAQTPKPKVAGGAGLPDQAASLAEEGHCTEAMPLLKRALHQVTAKDMKKRIALDGVHCAMTHDNPFDSLDFLAVLARDFPGDPEALYAASHAYSDLSLRASEDLARQAPFSYQVHELNAEALELQGKWDEAAAEYRKILELNPLLPGIHARLGRTLLSRPQPSAENVEQAKKNFEQELDIDSRNATAEYVLGQLAQNANDLSAAIRHYTRASKIDSGFAEAYLGLGMSLISAKRFAEAIPPLETYEKLAPDSPTGHYQLALAYAGVGRRDDANREAALQRETAESLEKVKRRVAEGLLQEQSEPKAKPPEPQN
jgi:tetratricopeptide (TPR) repeat protein